MMSRIPLASWLPLAALATVILACPQPSRADVYVLESTALSISSGRHLASGDTIVIPAGSFIRAVLPSGKTQTIKGPFSGPVADIDKGESHNEGVLAWIRTMLETGGAREATPGATRSIRPVAASAPRPAFSWSALPVTADATVCIEKDNKLQLVRTQSARADRVTIIDTVSGGRGEALWEAGSVAAEWPARLIPSADTSFYLQMPDQPQRQIRVHVFEKLPADDDVLMELHKFGCKLQFEAWVREKMGASAIRH